MNTNKLESCYSQLYSTLDTLIESAEKNEENIDSIKYNNLLNYLKGCMYEIEMETNYLLEIKKDNYDFQ